MNPAYASLRALLPERRAASTTGFPVEPRRVKAWVDASVPSMHKLFPAACAVLVVVAGKWMAARAAKRAPVEDLVAARAVPANHN